MSEASRDGMLRYRTWLHVLDATRQKLVTRREVDRMLAPTPPGAPEPTPPTIYTTSWCGYCARLKYSLDKAGVLYSEVDIEEVPAAAEIVTAANNGNRTVPTVVYADGTTMTNPAAGQVQAKLAQLAAV